MTLKIVFAGTPEFAVPTLEALIEANHIICAVYTQPDRPAGRGRKIKQSPVKEFALKYDLPIYQPESLRDESVHKQLRMVDADIMIVVAYGLLLPKEILAIPKLGCLNVHASLLPRWRGAAPIQRAILAGDEVTGITIMQMDEGLDTGAVLEQISCFIQPTDGAEIIHDRLAKLGARTLILALENLLAGKTKSKIQEHDKATYANKIDKKEGELDWNLSAVELDRKIRAFNPWPVAYSHVNGEVLRIWQAHPGNMQADLPPGTVCAINPNSIVVATGKGVLCLQRIQLPNRNPLMIHQFLNAHHDFFVPGKTKFD